MKKILSLLVLALLVVASCNKYDDTDLKNRVAALESLASYQTLLQKLQAGKTVTSYSKTENEITLTFSDGSSVTFNQQGEPGAPGTGIQGEPGKTPEVKIENDKWYVRYGEDGTWKEIGSAIDRSLIEDIKVVDDVLQITLAGGTVVNVPFGEKEGYTFTLGDGVRKCYSFFETAESYKTGLLKIPYTLTGDLKSEDDVTILANLTSFAEEYLPLNGFYEIEKTDAKSGYLVIHRFKEDARFESDEEIAVNFPGGILDITAYFPDGTIRASSIRILSEKIYLYAWDTCYFTDYDAPVLVGDQFQYFEKDILLPKEAGTLELYLYEHVGYSYDFQHYDGGPLYESTMGDRIFVSILNGPSYTLEVNYTLGEERSGRWGGSGGSTQYYREHPLIFTYGANNTGADRRTLMTFYTNPATYNNGSPSLFTVQLIQEH